jgi:hypothetical protein
LVGVWRMRRDRAMIVAMLLTGLCRCEVLGLRVSKCCDDLGVRRERRGEFCDFVDDEVGLPRVDDRVEVVGARHELEVGEDLGEEEVPLGVANELIEAGKRGAHSCLNSSSVLAWKASKPAWRARVV